jgi:biopolymer transport protein ExbB/TolQ
MATVFMEGGIFMWPIALCGLAAIVLALKKGVDLFGPVELTPAERRKGLALVYQLGLFGFVLGLFAQAFGIVLALEAIRNASDISPPIVMRGVQVSFYAPLFGMVVLLVAIVAWAILRYRADSLDAEEDVRA